MKKGFIASVGKFLVELPEDDNSFSSCPRRNQRASFFQNFVDIERFGLQMQLPGVGNRERKQSLYHSRELLQLIIKDGKRFLVFLRCTRLGEQKLRFPVKN